jgi:ABC-type multidrug transport system fused ATPase/permease subunit
MMAGSEVRGFWHNLGQLYGLFERHRRREIGALLALTLASGVAEVVTIGAVVPFLALLATRSAAGPVPWIGWIFDALGTSSRQGDLLLATILLCVAAVGAGLLRILLVWRTQAFVYSFGHRLAVEIQRRILFQPYSWHVAHNSSDQLATLEKVQLVTGLVLLPLVQGSAATVLVIIVTAVLLQIAPFATIAAGLGIAIAYVALARFARLRLHRNSEWVDAAFEQRIRILQEGVGGIRDVILDGSQATVLNEFRSADLRLTSAIANSAFISSIPRFLVESAGIVILAAVALVLSNRPGGLLTALPALGALAIGAQRLLPLLQQLYQGWSTLAANRAIIDDVVRRTRLEVPAVAAAGPRLAFDKSIQFDNVSFTYADRDRAAVEALTFDIAKGSRVALVGPTGSGKTTTADLLMGLLEPTAGAILIDGVPLVNDNRQAWRANVAHVPQMLFLADAPIAQNIALARTPDLERVRKAAALAQIDEFIESLPNGYDTRVGERGARLSGGQRQRLAIARAIYKDTPLLVLDEATSALDDETEAAIVKVLDRLQEQGRTIVIIAHRSTTTTRCDRLFRLKNGRITETVTR